jgi:hypothetical protein
MAETVNAPWFQSLGNISQMVSAIVAVGGVILVSCQVSVLVANSEEIKRVEQRTAARQVYMSYSDASMKYPQFASPDYTRITDPLEKTRYAFFVAHMLYAYDEMLKVFDDTEWMASFEYDLKLHMPYICQLNDPAFFDQYFL